MARFRRVRHRPRPRGRRASVLRRPGRRRRSRRRSGASSAASSSRSSRPRPDGSTDARYLAQGTLYPDVIESSGVRGTAAVIKTHHNVGGLPERLGLELVEPLRDLFKDEVRRLGEELGLPHELRLAPSLPGPGPGGADPRRGHAERVTTLQEADAIVIDEIRRGRSVRRDLPGPVRAAAGALRGRDGRSSGPTRRSLAIRAVTTGRLHDRGLVPLPAGRSRPHRRAGW